MFEKNTYPGGKLSELRLGNYRFDKGPSLFTLPELMDELSELARVEESSFPYQRLQHLGNYFFEDGTRLVVPASEKLLVKELHEKLGEDEKDIRNHLKKSAFYYNTVSDLFLKQSLHKVRNFLNFRTLKGLLLAPLLNLGSNMHQQNATRFKNKKTVQLFDRYATYNGSSPYKAPALLNLIPHLEFGKGAYLPQKGMHQITEHLQNLAVNLGVVFHYNEAVEKITLEDEKITGIVSSGKHYPCDLIVSDMDIHKLYAGLLPKNFRPEKILRQEKSSSAYVFYWGVQKEFEELDLHNILFSENYEEEFKHLFEGEKPFDDPTVYINITSKYCSGDAPKGCENWFVMVNVPHNASGKEITYGSELRRLVVQKINRMLHTDIEKYIVEEGVLDPYGIEIQTSSFGGSLYGNASNNRYAAFLRHSNFSGKLKGLYFVGGSVHPGGGIPLCLMGAKIVSQLIPDE